MAGKEENKKLKEYKNENYFFGDQTSGTFLIIGSVSWTKITLSHCMDIDECFQPC